MITCRRGEARSHRMRASVSFALLPGRRALGTSVLPYSFLNREGGVLLPAIEWKREVARPALAGRRSLGQGIGAKACFRGGFLAQRFAAVVGRPGPCHPQESGESASAPLRLCVEGWVGCFVMSLCLRAFVFATGMSGSVDSVHLRFFLGGFAWRPWCLGGESELPLYDCCRFGDVVGRGG